MIYEMILVFGLGWACRQLYEICMFKTKQWNTQSKGDMNGSDD